MNVTALFGDVDDFCQHFIPAWQQSPLPGETRQRDRAFTMSLAEVMTIFILFH